MKLLPHLLAAVLALAATVTQSAPPDPHAILAEVDKVVSDNGIDEARAVEIGGIRQWITVRGRDRRNPILLVIHGGSDAIVAPSNGRAAAQVWANAAVRSPPAFAEKSK